MFPIFHLPAAPAEFDHRPFEERRVIRRGAPEALRLEPLPPGAPFQPVAPRHPPAPPVPRRAGWAGWLGRLLRRRAGATAS